MKTRFAVLFLTVSLLFSGCIQPYTPPGGDTKPVPVVVVTPKVAYDTYTTDRAKNFHELAQRCLTGEFAYVSELVDASVALDKEAKKKRDKTVDGMVAKALGQDELDAVKAATLLNEIANDLDPKNKVELNLPNPEPAPLPPVKSGGKVALQ